MEKQLSGVENQIGFIMNLYHESWIYTHGEGLNKLMEVANIVNTSKWRLIILIKSYISQDYVCIAMTKLGTKQQWY